MGSCKDCESDQAFLRCKERPQPVYNERPIVAADLFAGCGGMSIGLQEAARRAGHALKIPLALDSDGSAVGIYKRNIPHAHAITGDVAGLFGGAIGTPLTTRECKIRKTIGELHVLLGGPPCQGHSDLNNHTRGDDPKNGLYLRMARAAEVLQPWVVIVENVASVQRDRRAVVDATTRALKHKGYEVAGRVLDLRRVGVPQHRRRFVLMASMIPQIDPKTTLDRIASALPHHPYRSVGWAIGDLLDVNSETVYETSSRASKVNQRRMAFLFKKRLYDLPNAKRPDCHRHGNHSYLSMYGRLRWNKPAQTITTGFGSMGQGRYVHPRRHRTITPHEAARLQTFPDWFDFGKDTPRGVLARSIGNAVPPILMIELGAQIIPALWASREVLERKRA
jgi:DNA (cytosine-5)-methyltransferase 1